MPYLPDDYTVRARAAPVFVVLAPLLVSLAVWAPGALTATTGSVAAIVWVGLYALLAQLGRDSGKNKEKGLWRQWGGAPAVRALRHRHSAFSAPLLARYQERMQRLLPDVQLPSRQEEREDPDAADVAYEACVQYLRGRTRDEKRFPMVFKENVSYGFRRNLWGMKPLGLAVALVGVLLCALQLRNASGGDDELGRTVALLGVVLNAALFGCWSFFITPGFVRVPAVAYGERLVEACELLSASEPETTSPSANG